VGTFANQLSRESFVLVAIFFMFALLAALTVMNMLIGVLCEVVSAVAATEKEEMLVGYVNGKLRKVVDLLDTDGDLKISKVEFVEILENMEAARALQEVGVDVVGLIDFAEFIFEDDELDQPTPEQMEQMNTQEVHEREKSLSFGDFMEVVLQLRGTNNATVKDIVDLRKFMRRALIQTNVHLASLQKQFRLSTKIFSEGRPSTYSQSPLDYLPRSSQECDAGVYATTSFELGGSNSSKVSRPASNSFSEADRRNHVDEPGIRIPEPQQTRFSVLEDGGYPVPPLPTPPANLLHHRVQEPTTPLHHRVQENQRLLWGIDGQDAAAFQGQWQPLDVDGSFSRPDNHPSLRRRPAGAASPKAPRDTKDDPFRELSDNQQWSDLDPVGSLVEVDELRGQMERLGKVLSAGLNEFNRICDGLDRDAAR